MTPYNPIDILHSFVEERKLGGSIIISDLGKDGAIGDEDLRSLSVRVYKLEELNQRYENWLEEVEKFGLDQLSLVRYLSILKDDPQLPFPLLPPWWKGGRAYKDVKPMLKNLSIQEL